MKKNFFLLAAVLLCVCGTAFGWGKTGHDAIAYIAECNLTPRAKKNIGKYLDGRSIVYYASWMDAVRATEPYRATSKWHGFDADAECRYVPRPAEGDAVLGIEDAMEKLRGYRRQDDSTVRVAICCLVHLVGDMHCPTHVKYPWYSSTAGNALSTASGTPRRWNSTTAGVTRTTAISSTAARSPSAAPLPPARPANGPPRTPATAA